MNFLTLKAQNYLIALYRLSIRYPYPPYPEYQSFTFPISPQRIRKVPIAMSQPYDTMGSAAQAGVNRQVDRYGMSPFTYEIEGTTGWDYHMTDGFQYPGIAAINNLIDMLYTYDQLNAEQMLSNNPNSYIMEWSDFFNGEFYQVEPYGAQEIHQSERSPLLQYYRLKLVGIQPISDPIAELVADDPIANILASSAPVAIGDAIQVSQTLLSNY